MKRTLRTKIDKTVHALAVKLRKMEDGELVAKFYESYRDGFNDALRGRANEHSRI